MRCPAPGGTRGHRFLVRIILFIRRGAGPSHPILPERDETYSRFSTLEFAILPPTPSLSSW